MTTTSAGRVRRSQCLSVAAAALLSLSALTSCAESETQLPGTTASSASSPDVGNGSSLASNPSLTEQLGAVERDTAARVGVYLHDLSTGQTVSYRADERFTFASTIKALSAGVTLADATGGELGTRLTWTADELVDYSPVTENHVDSGLTLREVIRAAVVESDNTAANELYEYLGGPDAFEQQLRDLGDTTTSADRIEPELNTVTPGDDRDTSTPQALGQSLEALVFGDAMPRRDQRLLTRFMRQSTTGLDLIRAATPSSWVVGDKSGTGGSGTRNDIAVIRTDDGRDLVMTVMTTHTDADAEPDDSLVSRVAEAALAEMGLTSSR